ncbi:hypothetical protein JCM19237_3189 [Photobacterium aphoticum]|uniref:Uncharacterized protein n=1 Tax=Photobacterium aphoticum TaxID=754436 RepID=A0A090QZS3_9GAMM|nr:hypothetical protein JCM19237_3189 [Photobacterium aphoticum]
MAALLSEPEVEPSRADAFEQVEVMDETSVVDHATESAPQSVSVSDAAVDELEREALFSPATSAAETIDASLSEDEAMSAEDDAIWSAANVEPELEGEDWTSQPEMHTEDVPAFDQDDAALDAVTASVTAPESVLDEIDYAAQMPAPEAVAPVEHAVQEDTSWQDDSESVLLTEEKPAPAPTRLTSVSKS